MLGRTPPPHVAVSRGFRVLLIDLSRIAGVITTPTVDRDSELIKTPGLDPALARPAANTAAEGIPRNRPGCHRVSAPGTALPRRPRREAVFTVRALHGSSQAEHGSSGHPPRGPKRVAGVRASREGVATGPPSPPPRGRWSGQQVRIRRKERRQIMPPPLSQMGFSCKHPTFA